MVALVKGMLVISFMLTRERIGIKFKNLYMYQTLGTQASAWSTHLTYCSLFL